ncbi:hypothetical protein WN55_10000 [Dufourea novaeangliae]|uniref:Uncharacterized protein n=1 Tax=Dufourea novaeangliae TaxID=178035 RepID=A0A154P875_DUFNO|nr:hypothetical protein WN55_10000 [Dufourea novaeangliae]
MSESEGPGGETAKGQGPEETRGNRKWEDEEYETREEENGEDEAHLLVIRVALLLENCILLAGGHSRTKRIFSRSRGQEELEYLSLQMFEESEERKTQLVNLA